MKNKKTRIKVIIIVSCVVAFLIIQAVFLLRTFLPFFGIGQFTVAGINVSVDNSYRNTENNIWSDAVGSGDNVLYFNAYNRFPKSGIYQFYNGIGKKVYSGELSILNQSFPFSNCVYKGYMVELRTDDVYYLNPDSGKYEFQFHLPHADNDVLSDIFTVNGELYYTCKNSDVIYHYKDENTPDIAASDKLCGSGYIPCDYYKNYMIFYKQDEYNSEAIVENDFGNELSSECGIRKLYLYDLEKRTVEKSIDFSKIDDIMPDKNCALESHFVLDSGVYLFVRQLEPLEKHYSAERIENDDMLRDTGCGYNMIIYYYKFSDGEIDKVKTYADTSLTVNGWGEYLFVKSSFEEGDGSYFEVKDKVDKISGKFIEEEDILSGEDVKSICIFDKAHLYYTTDDNKLKSIEIKRKIFERKKTIF